MKSEQLYLEVRPMIGYWSWHYHRLTGIEHDELMAQGNLIYCECYDKYDEDRGAAFSSYLYSALDHGLSNWCRDRQRQVNELNGVVDQIIDHHHARSDRFVERLLIHEAVSQLSEEAKQVLDIIFTRQSTRRLRESRGGSWQWKDKPITRMQLRRYLIEHKKWSRPKVKHYFYEIESMLASISA